jgi:hypothetical protein
MSGATRSILTSIFRAIVVAVGNHVGEFEMVLVSKRPTSSEALSRPMDITAPAVYHNSPPYTWKL